MLKLVQLTSFGGDRQIARCIIGSFLLRAAASGAVALISFFIADMERSGAHLTCSNHAPPETGAVVRIVWPTAVLALPANESALRQAIHQGDNVWCAVHADDIVVIEPGPKTFPG